MELELEELALLFASAGAFSLAGWSIAWVLWHALLAERADGVRDRARLELELETCGKRTRDLMERMLKMRHEEGMKGGDPELESEQLPDPERYPAVAERLARVGHDELRAELHQEAAERLGNGWSEERVAAWLEGAAW